MFLSVKGASHGVINGESIDDKHKGEIEVLSWSWGIQGKASLGGGSASGKATIRDASELDPVIDGVIAANGAQVASFKAGKEGVLGYLVGQVMRETQGKANPKIVNERLREKLGA